MTATATTTTARSRVVDLAKTWLPIRRHLARFCEYASNGAWHSSRHLEVLCAKLEAVERGEIKRLIVNFPRRHSKSETGSRMFPAYLLGKHPDWEIILSSYGFALASSLSRDCRHNFRTACPSVFGVDVSDESWAVGHWEVAGHRGQLHAAGAGGAVAGHGAQVAIIDDPHKSIREARSLIAQRALYDDWYQGVLRPTLAPGGAIVVLTSRYHPGDICGRLIADMEKGGEQWEVLSLPAIAKKDDPIGREVGEALWPERYPIEELEAIRAATRGYVFDAEFQQEPHSETKDAMWTQERLDELRVAEAPELRRVVVAIDPAVTSNVNSDETGIAVAALGIDGHGYLLSDRSGVFTPNTWAQRAVDAIARFDGDCIVGEANNGGDLVEVNVRTVSRSVRYKKVTASRGKARRAEPISSLYEQGRVHHVGDAGQFEDLEYQLTRMTPHGYDGEGSPDRLDALVWAFWELMLGPDDTPRVRRL